MMRAVMGLFFILGQGCDQDPPYKGIEPNQADPASPGLDEETEREIPDSDDTGASADWPEVSTLPVEVDALIAHLQALQDIADAHDGNRSAGSTGFDASVDYVTGQLEEVGYTVSLHDFTITNEIEHQPPELELLSGGRVFVEGEDFTSITYTGSGDVNGSIISVDLQLPPGPSANDSSSGCEAGDFFGFPEGGVALIQRGSCAFQDKVDFAIAAGAVAVVIFNEGQDGRRGLFAATLGRRAENEVPVLALTFEVGEYLAELAESGDTNLRVMVDVEQIEVPTANVIAETMGGGEDVVVVGAHLDSVGAGPGINDNGSGAMLVLEIARVMAMEEIATTNPVRWIFWGGEELGLLGSMAYVRELDDAAYTQILANLNFDMVASPNPVRFVYDGDGSATGTSGPAGSGPIEQMFHDWFGSEELVTTPTPFDGRSDYGPFIWAGIPAGGLFTGAEQQKTEEEADVYGGTPGVAYDQCYHQACDTIDNIDRVAYAEMAAAAGHAVLSLGELEGGFTLSGPPAPETLMPMIMPLTAGGCHTHSASPELR